MIKTERLIIRPLHYYELVSRVYSHTGAVSAIEEQQNIVKGTLIPMSKAPEEDHIYYTFWVGYDKGEEVVEVGFLSPPDYRKGLEIWCYTNKQFMNKGYGTEAIKGLVKWTTSKGIDFVCASVNVDNLASKKMLEKSGFKYFSKTHSNMDAYIILN